MRAQHSVTLLGLRSILLPRGSHCFQSCLVGGMCLCSFILPLNKPSLVPNKSNLNYFSGDSWSLLQQVPRRDLFAGPAWPSVGQRALLAFTTNAAVCMFQDLLQPALDTRLWEDRGTAMRLGPCPASRHGMGRVDIRVLPLSLMPAVLLLLLSPTGELLRGVVGGGNFIHPQSPSWLQFCGQEIFVVESREQDYHDVLSGTEPAQRWREQAQLLPPHHALHTMAGSAASTTGNSAGPSPRAPRVAGKMLMAKGWELWGQSCPGGGWDEHPSAEDTGPAVWPFDEPGKAIPALERGSAPALRQRNYPDVTLSV